MDWPLKAVKSKATKIKGGVDKNMFRTAGKKDTILRACNCTHILAKRASVLFFIYFKICSLINKQMLDIQEKFK